ncbi:MAG: CpaF family protein [Pseudomonadota bacterium]
MGQGQAKVIPFSTTPIYRVFGHEGLELEVVNQVFAVLSDRLEEPDQELAECSPSYLDELRQTVAALSLEIQEELGLELTGSEQEELLERLMDEVVGLGPLQALIEDPSIEDILVNGPAPIYVERRGRLQQTDCRFRSPRHLKRVAQRMAGRLDRPLSERNPIVDARLPDGSRINIVDTPPALDGLAISIRKPKRERISLERMARQGNLSADMAALLAAAVRCRLNILVVGPSGSGKTTLLGALAESFGADERIIAIEDVTEFQAPGRHLVSLECRPPHNGRGGEVTQRDLLKNALRMTPDRLVMGEVRGDEVIDLLQAMITGHDGVLGTLHAGSVAGALQRLETLMGLAGIDAPAASLRGQIAWAVDLVVILDRGEGGHRRVTEIREVVGMEGETIVTHPLYAYRMQDDGQSGAFEASGLRPRFAQRAREMGVALDLDLTATEAAPNAAQREG